MASAAGPIATLLVLPIVWKLGHSYQAIRLLLAVQLGIALCAGFVLSETATLEAEAVSGAGQAQLGFGVALRDWVLNRAPVASWVPHAFIVLHRGICGCTFALFGMAVSDVAEHDARMHRRPHKLTTSVFALNALVTKPAESFAPMLVLAILGPLGYAAGSGEAAADPDQFSEKQQAGLASGMWAVLWGSAALASCV